MMLFVCHVLFSVSKYRTLRENLRSTFESPKGEYVCSIVLSIGL
jgi:hypothetical protein